MTGRPDALLADLGERIAVMDRELAMFAHAAMHRFFHWDSKHAFATIPEHEAAIATGRSTRAPSASRRGGARARLVPLLPGLRMSVIHNDVNDHNLLVGDDGRVSGIIDFGDMVHTYTACELANALAYLVLDATDPGQVIEVVTAAYERVHPLERVELDALDHLIVLRLCLSVTMAARQRAQDPGNAYLGVTESAAWAFLENVPDSLGMGDPLRAARAGARRERRRTIDDLRRDPPRAPGPHAERVVPITARDRARRRPVSLRSRWPAIS